MSDDLFILSLRARADAVPDAVHVPADQVWRTVRRRRTRAVVGTSGLAAVALGVAAMGLAGGPPWLDDERPVVVASPTPDPSGDPSTPSPTRSDEQDCPGSDDPSSCGTVAGIPGWSAELQDLLMTYSMPFVAALGLGEDGFTFSYEPPTITIWQAEPPPGALDQAIAEAEAAGVTIVWRETPYDITWLEAQCLPLMEALHDAGIEVTGVGPESGATGIRVGTADELVGTARAEALRIAADVVPGVPVRFFVETAPIALRLPWVTSDPFSDIP